jgi:hypothetical protein
VRFQTVTVTSIKVKPCEIYRRVVSLEYTDVSDVRTASVIRVSTVMMEAICTFETSVYSNGTTRHYIPEGSYLQINCLCVSLIFIYSVLNFALFFHIFTFIFLSLLSTYFLSFLFTTTVFRFSLIIFFTPFMLSIFSLVFFLSTFLFYF